MKNALKLIIISAVVIMMLGAFAGCQQNAAVTQVKPVEGAAPVKVEGSCTVELLSGRTVRVHCSLNLMEDTAIAIAVDKYDGENISTQKLTVPGPNFYADFTVPENVEGPFVASLCVAPSSFGKQPTAVKEAYGSQLQNLTGEYIIFNSEGNLVCILSDEFEL